MHFDQFLGVNAATTAFHSSLTPNGPAINVPLHIQKAVTCL